MDLFVVFSPERVSSGRVFADLARYPKLVGGVDPESGRRAVEFYGAGLRFDERPDLARPNGVWDLGSAEAAELAKLAETTYRDVNIGLANQFALYADRIGVDFHRIAEACNSQPFSHLHAPGIAVGGHCIPVYPWFYLCGDPDATIVRAARRRTARCPSGRCSGWPTSTATCAAPRSSCSGPATGAGSRRPRSPGCSASWTRCGRAGRRRSCTTRCSHRESSRRSGSSPTGTAMRVDAAVLQADHEEYRGFTPADLPGVSVLLDGRGVLDPTRWPDVTVLALGRSTVG